MSSCFEPYPVSLPWIDFLGSDPVCTLLLLIIFLTGPYVAWVVFGLSINYTQLLARCATWRHFNPTLLNSLVLTKHSSYLLCFYSILSFSVVLSHFSLLKSLGDRLGWEVMSYSRSLNSWPSCLSNHLNLNLPIHSPPQLLPLSYQCIWRQEIGCCMYDIQFEIKTKWNIIIWDSL